MKRKPLSLYTFIKKLPYLLSLLFMLNAAQASAQSDTDLVQLSGLILTNDSLKTMPFVSIRLKGSWRGTISDIEGFFSIVAHKKDTIEFSSVGYKRAVYVIPAKLASRKYSIVQLMTQDTITYEGVTVYAFPYPPDIIVAVRDAENLPDGGDALAKRNLERERLRELGSYLSMDGRENYRYYMRQQVGSYYYAGQLPPQNIFSPLAWAQFIEAWKRGDFKRKY
jgi:hypothetical protein